MDNNLQSISPTCPNNKEVTRKRDKISTQYERPRIFSEWEKPENIEVRVGSARQPSNNSNNRQQNITRIWHISRNNKNQEYERRRIKEDKSSFLTERQHYNNKQCVSQTRNL